jgi:hypothetical protein
MITPDNHRGGEFAGPRHFVEPKAKAIALPQPTGLLAHPHRYVADPKQSGLRPEQPQPSACLMFFSGFHAKREPLPGTLYMPDSGGGWIVNRLVFEDRVVV